MRVPTDIIALTRAARTLALFTMSNVFIILAAVQVCCCRTHTPKRLLKERWWRARSTNREPGYGFSDCLAVGEPLPLCSLLYYAESPPRVVASKMPCAEPQLLRLRPKQTLTQVLFLEALHKSPRRCVPPSAQLSAVTAAIALWLWFCPWMRDACALVQIRASPLRRGLRVPTERGDVEK